MYLVIYEDDGTLEGYVKSKEHFKTWLNRINDERQEQDELIYDENEFRLDKIKELV